MTSEEMQNLAYESFTTPIVSLKEKYPKNDILKNEMDQISKFMGSTKDKNQNYTISDYYKKISSFSENPIIAETGISGNFNAPWECDYDCPAPLREKIQEAYIGAVKQLLENDLEGSYESLAMK